ncbi:MAG: hypothetical protein ACK55I_13250, partial [bacterium]
MAAEEQRDHERPALDQRFIHVSGTRGGNGGRLRNWDRLTRGRSGNRFGREAATVRPRPRGDGGCGGLPVAGRRGGRTGAHRPARSTVSRWPDRSGFGGRPRGA